MSFDVDMRCTHCNSMVGGLDLNITHNVNSIVDACLVEAAAQLGVEAPTAKTKGSGYEARAWGRLHGWSGEEAFALSDMAARISREPAQEERFRAMEPANKWGDLDGVRDCLRSLADACQANPKGVIHAGG